MDMPLRQTPTPHLRLLLGVTRVTLPAQLLVACPQLETLIWVVMDLLQWVVDTLLPEACHLLLLTERLHPVTMPRRLLRHRRSPHSDLPVLPLVDLRLPLTAILLVAAPLLPLLQEPWASPQA